MLSLYKNLPALILSTVCLLVVSSVPAHAQDDAMRDTMLTAAGWAEFSSNLRTAIASDNEGAKVGALGQIIRYGQFLKFDELTVFEVMRMYRDNEDQKIRRMAVVALGNMNNRWAIEFLDMLSRYEENETIKATMERVVKDHRMMKSEM
jgi:hypothetical protein